MVVTLPHGEGYVLYKIGCADGAITGSNGTQLTGPCIHCSGGAESGFCPGCDQSYERTCQDALHATSLDGPWTRFNLTGFAFDGGGWNWPDLNLGLESHTPIVMPNGSILTFTRSWAAPKPYPNSAIWLVRADRWNGTYNMVPRAIAAQPVFDVSLEDSFMWIDPRGNYHGLFHTFSNPNVGGHAYSTDGLRWQYSPTPAYNLTVAVDGGRSHTFARRERPHLLLTLNGDPSYLSTGVTPTPQEGLGDWSFTLVQPIHR